jgi:hypothetical protein
LAVTVFDPAFPAVAASAVVCRWAKLQETDRDSDPADWHSVLPVFDPVFQVAAASGAVVR